MTGAPTPAKRQVDGVDQQASDSWAGINPQHCARFHRDTVPAHPGFSFCRDCLAWLRCETDDDPLCL